MSDIYVVGVDFGGTHIRAGLCDENGRLHSSVKTLTPSDRDPSRVIGRIVEVIEQAISEANVPSQALSGVAIGACGLVERQSGLFVSSSVLPNWRNVPLASQVSQTLGIPVIVDNDANAAIFGECWVGVARARQNVVGMTLGTGIGGAAILNRDLFYGARGNSAEFGHMTVEPDGPECFCGNRGCLGLLASATGVVRRYHEQIERLPDGPPKRTTHANLEVTAESIHQAAASGNKTAQETIEQTGRYLGIGTANLLSCFNPDMVVFTGGLTGMGERLLKTIREEAYSRTYPSLGEASQIEFGELGDWCGVIGAAGILAKTGQGLD